VHLIQRKKYLNEALRFRDTDLIKVITGIRRCGKSSLLELIALQLKDEGIADTNIIKLNLESLEVNICSPEELYQFVKAKLTPGKRCYLFIDEVQNVFGWERAVNAMRVDFNCDLYVTGSNAYLLSSELSTYLSGRYVEVRMLPLVFAEYLDFRGLAPAPLAGQEGLLVDKQKNNYLLSTVFADYQRFGGMPALAKPEIDQQAHHTYMQALYDSVITRDILDRERDKSRRTITQPDLLRRICLFLADNIGNFCSTNNIKNVLEASGRRIGSHTVDAYIEALLDAYAFYRAKRFDIRGKEHLKTIDKYYLSDPGLRSYLLGYRDADQGRVLENIVFLQLLYDGYSVSVGKLYNKEIDFVAMKDEKRVYIQVTESMVNSSVIDRELNPLLSIKDAYKKIVIVNGGSHPRNIEGVEIKKATEFLMDTACHPDHYLLS